MNNSRASEPRNLVDLLVSRRLDSKPTYRFLHADDREAETLSPAELDERARAIAVHLVDMGLAGGQALLLFPSGLEFIVAFFGCLYAGVTAVPAYPPRRNKSLERLQAIIKDCRPGAVLSVSAVRGYAEPMFAQVPELAGLPWLACDDLDLAVGADWQQPEIRDDSLAFLQYTSGSTGHPKGVMVSHGNLIANQRAMVDLCNLSPQSRGVGWLPLFHDMGLIGMALHPLYRGFPVTLMAPATFLQQPVRWLQAISDTRATATLAPNFSFDLCVRDISEEDRAGLDLSSLEFVMSGAEPVRPETMERFAEVFAPNGFRPEAFRPAYGLAENTLITTCSGSHWKSIDLDAEKLSRGQFERPSDGKTGTRLTALGRAASGQHLAIVDPETCVRMNDGEVGEIWISGDSVAQGYWNNPEETERTFRARLAADDRHYLRTGDLGALRNGELFVTGRLKDLIIIAGKNHYPQDIELTLDRLIGKDSLPLQAGAAAAFSINTERTEKLVIVVETTREGWRLLRQDGKSLEQLISSLRREMAREHELTLHGVAFIKPGSLPKTSSGKVRRSACRDAWLKGALDQVATAVPGQQQANVKAEPQKPGQEAIQSWLQTQVARLVGMEPEQIALNEDLANYGLSSISAMRLAGELESWLGCRVSPNLAWDFPNIQDMSAHLAAASSSQGARNPDIKIDSANRYQPFPLNEIQQAYWLGRSNSFVLGNSGCHYYAEFDSETLDVGRLTVAWNKLVARHDMLRAVVDADGKQHVLEQVPEIDNRFADLSSLSQEACQQHLLMVRETMSHRVYDTAIWPLHDWRVHEMPGGSRRLHLSIDLLMADVWSLMHLLDEWHTLYEQPDLELPAIEVSFRDCLLDELASRNGEARQAALTYWKERAINLPSGPKLPLASNPEMLEKPVFKRREAVIGSGEWGKLKKRAADMGLTPSMLLCSAFAEVLGGWSKEAHFSLTLTLFNRPRRHADIDKVVGDFTSVLLLEVDGKVGHCFKDRAQKLQRQFRADLEHSSLSGVEVLRMANQAGQGSVSMPVVFTSALGGEQAGAFAANNWPGVKGYSISQTPQVWLDHQALELDGRLMLSWDAVEALFPAQMLDDMFESYLGLLGLLTRDIGAWDADLPVLLPARQQAIIRRVNSVSMPLPQGLLHWPFMRQAQVRGNSPAIISSRQCMSHQQLHVVANRIAHRLRAQGAQPNQLVAVVMEKGCEQIAAVMGILESGAAYLPIDPALPKDRIWTLLAMAEARLVLTQSWVQDALEWPEHLNLTVTALDRDDLSNESTHSLQPVQTASDLAYVIFTSGSTGTPKGVMIDHAGALNTVVDINQRYAVQQTDSVLAVSSLSFDLSVYDIFGVLGAGGAVVIPDAAQHNDPQHWAELMVKHSVSIWNSAPALMENLLEYTASACASCLNSVRLTMMSGDWIPLHVPTQLKRANANMQVVSLGGATEASIWSIYHDIDQVLPHWRSVPYGKPLTNQRFYVLDERLEPRPFWVTGQLYIGGVGVSKGYWKSPERTQASFITHPRTGETLYRTGDLGRLLPDGEIEFLGREDFQVKIQGYRIELGEIESVLNRHPAVQCSVVNAWVDHAGAKHLVAYVLPLLTLDRVALHGSCRVEDEFGQDYLLQALDISRNSIRLEDAPGDWLIGQKLYLSVPIGENGERHAFSGAVETVEGEIAEIRLDLNDDIEAKVDATIQRLAGGEEGLAGFCSFRYRVADGRRSQFRAPLGISCVALHQEEAFDVDVLDISCEGLRLGNLPAHLKRGDRLQVRLPMPHDDGEVLWLNGQIQSYEGKAAGVSLNLNSRERLQMSAAVAYLVARDGYWLTEQNLSHVRDFVAERLPSYMTPKHFILLNALPLSSNGKVDRKALPEPVLENQNADSLPRNDLEAQLAHIWSDILGVREVGVHDNFFELGGYSQLAVRALLRIRETLNTDIPLRALFEAPTIAELAHRIGSHQVGSGKENQEQADTGSLYGQYARRGIYHRIQAIRADKDYTSAKGLQLTYEEHGQDIQVLDLVGGYGSTLLGHNHPELTEYAKHLVDMGVPMHAQHTDNQPAGMLGKRLSDLIGAYTGARYVATFASTGTEAVEAGIKHAKQEFTSRAKRQKANDDNLCALLMHQVRRGRLHLREHLFLEVEAKTGLELERTPEALVQAVVAYNESIYQKEPLFLALAHSFHGMTSGALSLTASADFRKPFQWMGIRAQWITHRVRALQAVVEQEQSNLLILDVGSHEEVMLSSRPWCGIGALFIEPIQGEGGIYPVSETLATGAREVADQHGFPLIIDEIQCGMGRSGTFCAAEQIGLRGDYYVFSKSLGGGLTKVSALMVDERRYQKDFGYYHGSTFAEDRPSCMMALKTLDIMDRDGLVQRASVQGELFMKKLRQLKDEYPELIADVRGRGLMIGLELAGLQESQSFLLRALAHGGMEILNYLIAGYLLNRKQVRIAPTKTRNTIRFLPSAYISEAEMDKAVGALSEVFELIKKANPGRLMRYVVDPDYQDTQVITDWRDQHPVWEDQPAGTEPRVAHIGHLEDAEGLLLAEPSMAEIPADLREDLLRVLFPVSKVGVAQQLLITSDTGEKVHLSIIGLALTGKLFEEMMASQETRELLLEKIDEAIALARNMNCTQIGFGGYTSIVTANCTSVATNGVWLTSGNSYTTALGLEGLRREVRRNGIDMKHARLGVVGAKGNIGSISARLLARDAGHMVLFGRDVRDDGLLEVAHSIYQDAWLQMQQGNKSGIARTLLTLGEQVTNAAHDGDPQQAGGRIYEALLSMGERAPISISDDLHGLAGCDAVLSATSSARPIIFPEHLSERTKVICDIATPSDVDASVSEQCHWISVLSGGLARLPGHPGYQLLGTHLPLNHVFGCVAETCLLGLIGYQDHFSFGAMDKEQVEMMSAAAKEHGFSLGEVKRTLLQRAGSETQKALA